MKYILKYVKPCAGMIVLSMLLKLTGTMMELMIPYVMEHILDSVAPTHSLSAVLLWGVGMILLAIVTRFFNVTANRSAIRSSRKVGYEVRRDLFARSITLSGEQTDSVTLPSLTSRMTSDTYNIQNIVQRLQTIGIRAPIMLVGGIAVTLSMDTGLASILCIMAPIMILVVVFVSRKGIPLYDKVQQGVDDIVRVMRENITGIRVVKALSREKHEMDRFNTINEEMAQRETKAGIVMALPGPLITFALNIGLIIVVLVGAQRVNDGVTQPGVILAFLTYFNMILTSVMALNRVFMMLSKANASANRIAEVLALEDELSAVPEEQAAHTDRDGFLVFDHVSFSYGREKANEDRRMALKNIDFSIPKGGSLGIIGPTGCGKTTIINLLMRFYDATEGAVFVDGRDVRTYDIDELRRKFGVVLQNDVLFADSLRENLSFGRDVDDAGLEKAAEEAQAIGFIRHYPEGFDRAVDIRGANYSGGQKQRLLISRALAGNHEVLILDDSSSALDYRTDAALRQAIAKGHRDITMVVVAQRISSIMNMDHILVLDEGAILGQGTHEELMASCPAYREIYQTQMGEVK